MSEQETLDRLRDWDKAEMIYRDAYRMRHGQLSQEELEKQYADNPRILNYALYPDSFLDTLPEERVITEGRHTAVSKHPRYLTYLFHTHVFFEMTYVVEGTCTQFFDNASQEMKPGDFCILSPETRHYIYDFNEAIVVNILIRSSTFMDIFHGLMRQNTKISQFFAGNLYSRKKLRYMMFHAGDDAEIRRLILAMYDEEQRNDAYSDNIIVNLISIVFSQLLRRHSADMETPRLRREGGDRTISLNITGKSLFRIWRIISIFPDSTVPNSFWN